MPLDQSYMGRVYPPTPPYEVGREKIREFADAVCATDPVHRDLAEARARGYRDVIAPPTFAIILSQNAGQQLVEDHAFGMDYSRVVHGGQTFRYERPIVAGDHLVTVMTVEEISSRAGHAFLTTRHEVATVEGEPVVTVWTRLVIRGEG
jgi:acyl dehydratase